MGTIAVQIHSFFRTLGANSRLAIFFDPYENPDEEKDEAGDHDPFEIGCQVEATIPVRLELHVMSASEQVTELLVHEDPDGHRV